jgi:hypothetical protein
VNRELLRLYEADVAEHAQGNLHGTAEYAAMRERDRQRRQHVGEMIAANQLHSGADYFHAARIFQHGDTADDAWQAYQLARWGAAMGEPRARWMAAAAYDRWLMYLGRPQKYGT